MTDIKPNVDREQFDHFFQLGYSDELQDVISKTIDGNDADTIEESMLRIAKERQISEHVGNRLIEAINETLILELENNADFNQVLIKLGVLIEKLSLQPFAICIIFLQLEYRLEAYVRDLKGTVKPIADARLDTWLGLLHLQMERVYLIQLKNTHVGRPLAARLEEVKECCASFAFDSSDWKDYQAELERMDPFDVLLEQLQIIRDTREKISHIVKEKTEWERSNEESGLTVSGRTFGEKCDLEISKYKQLLELGIDQSKTIAETTGARDGHFEPAESERALDSTGDISDGTCAKCGKGEKYPDRNLEVVTLILDDILLHSGIRPGNGPLSTESYFEIIGFITGYSRHTTKRTINNPYVKEEKYRDAFEKDCDVRRDVLKKLGLHELAKRVQ